MFYDSDIRLVCDTYSRSHIGAQVLAAEDFCEALAERGIESALGISAPKKLYASLLASPIMSTTMYKISDAFGLKYIYFLLPGHKNERIFLVGPYVSETPSREWMLKKLEEYALAPSKERWLSEYFSSIPVISESSRMLDLVDTLCERIWQSPSFNVVDMALAEYLPDAVTPDTDAHISLDEELISIKAIEQRYKFENELMDAVARGQIHKLGQVLSSFSFEFFEMRTTDRLRNLKNYCIIMNTLLRKAAERGGVHPIQIDRISSDFAVRIEHLPKVNDVNSLMSDMINAYCRQVKRSNTAHLSPVVQKTVLLIERDLSADLSLSALAKCQNVSSGYLSAVFKKETGKTLSQYVREARIAYAKHLLRTSDLQIQTIAQHCGIMDVQYFSKMFKKETSKTPKEYREE